MTTTQDLYPLFSDVPLCADDVLAIAAALRDIASADGTHEAELELIESLVGEISEDLDEQLQLQEMNPDKLAQQLPGDELRATFIRVAVLLTLADGKIGDKERARTLEYASALGISEADYTAAEQSITQWTQDGDMGPLFS